MTELIVMLTKDDKTLKNAISLFESAKDSKAKFWGFKEQGLEKNELEKLSALIKKANKTPVLEVVAYDEQSGIEGAKMAKLLGCEILLGTCFFESILSFCKENKIAYFPYIGEIFARPSVLKGDAKTMIKEADNYAKMGVSGVNLLAYRHESIDGASLAKSISKEIKAPLCVAGSIDSYEKLAVIKEIAPRFFTIGTAFISSVFGASLSEQINKVCKYLKE